MKSSASICLAPELSSGPFLFHAKPADLPSVFDTARQLGYDAVELLVNEPSRTDPQLLERMLSDAGLSLSAVGTGYAAITRGWTLTHADHGIRRAALDFAAECIDVASPMGARIIIGALQGKLLPGMPRLDTIAILGDALRELGTRLQGTESLILLEPLNRYETNVINSLGDAVQFIDAVESSNVAILADLFHMNIEEADICTSLQEAGKYVAHVHLADSNRQPAGLGHIDTAAVGCALRSMGFNGYVAMEALPVPNSIEAAKRSLAAFRRDFLRNE